MFGLFQEIIGLEFYKERGGGGPIRFISLIAEFRKKLILYVARGSISIEN